MGEGTTIEPMTDETSDNAKEPTPENRIGQELDDLDRELAGFDERVRKIRSSNVFPEPPDLAQRDPKTLTEKQRKIASDREASRGLGVGLSIAYTIIGVPIFGYFVGYLIDRQVGGKLFAPLFTTGGAVLGLTYAVWVLQRNTK